MQDKVFRNPTDEFWGAVQALSELPSAERTGYWIEHEWAEEVDGVLVSNYECSSCHSWKREASDFCPHCGVRMVKE